MKKKPDKITLSGFPNDLNGAWKVTKWREGKRRGKIRLVRNINPEIVK